MVAKSNPPPGGGGHEVVTEPEMKRTRKPKEPGASSDAEQHKKKRKRIEEAATNSAQVIEDPGAASGSESHMKRKKKKKRHEEPTSTGLVSNSQSGEGFDADTGAGMSLKKMEKKKKSITTSMENVAQVARDSGFGSDGESHEKKKKKKRKKQKELIVVPAVVNDLQIVDDEELVVDAEPQLRKKKVKESISTASTMSNLQVVEELEPASGAEALVKKKKKKKATEFTLTPGTVSSMQIVEDQELVNGAEAHRKKKTRKEVTSKPSTSKPETIAEDQDLVSDVELQSKKKKKKKNKPTTLLPELNPSQIVDDSRPITGSATKTILRKQPVEAGHVSEPHRKKKVTFQLPDPTQSAPTENEPTIEETGSTEFYNWSNDRTRTDLVWGGYTPEEDGALKQAIFDYIKEQGWTREEGIKKILNSRRSEATGCWFVIRKCLPQRELKRIYTRARKILGPGTHLGKWTSEEVQALMELQSVHGNNWKKISAMIGRDSYSCRDKWRITKWSHTKTGLKAGAWSTEEQQKLCALVLKSLHVKSQMTKNGQIKKDHRVIRDDINWEFIAEKMEGRDRLACMTQWYRKMASPMVTTGEWANGDDQLLLERLMEEFPLSEELVEWDLLLKHRSGDVCKRRWEQMLRSLGRSSAVQHQHFLEKLENVTKMFAPHLLDKEYDQQFAEEMQKADVDKPDGEGDDEEEDDN